MHRTLKAEATKPLRYLRRALQRRAAPSSPRHESARRRLYAITAGLPWARGVDVTFHDATVTVTRCGRLCWHGRKINLSLAFAGQNVGRHAGQRPRLARDLYGLRFGVLRRGRARRADRQSVRRESVTYVLGIIRHLCDRKIPQRVGSPHWTISATGSSARLRDLAAFGIVREGFAPRSPGLRSARVTALSECEGIRLHAPI